MRDQSLGFFHSLLESAGPTGDERAAARTWRAYTSAFAQVTGDGLGSSFATVNPEGSPSLAVVGHIDEIGLVVTHIDDDGFLWFRGVGGWDPEVLVGQRVRVLSRSGPTAGVIGKKSRHLQEADDRDKQSRIDSLWIDIGATDGDSARQRARVGDLAVLEQPILQLTEHRLVSRAADNRCGAFVAAEVARLYAESPGACRVTGVATVAEETTFAGAFTSAFSLAPDVAIAVDVTNATDYPTTSKQKTGDVRLGRGPTLLRGAAIHPRVFELLVETAESEGIPHQVEASSGHTGTDADAVHRSRGGIPSGVVSIPLRYMHSPNEQLQLGDLEACATLIAAFARRLDASTDLS
ncbi:MAG: M42 family metallopeptidase [Gaiellales bacterium]